MHHFTENCVGCTQVWFRRFLYLREHGGTCWLTLLPNSKTVLGSNPPTGWWIWCERDWLSVFFVSPVTDWRPVPNSHPMAVGIGSIPPTPPPPPVTLLNWMSKRKWMDLVALQNTTSGFLPVHCKTLLVEIGFSITVNLFQQTTLKII